MKLDDLQQQLAKGEDLDREFKSDRNSLADREIYEEVVAARYYDIPAEAIDAAAQQGSGG